MDAQGFYQTLDVPPDATAAEIKSAYRAKAVRAHPDKGGDAAEFSKVSQAYAVLSVPEKRRRYDAGEAPSEMTVEQRVRGLLVQQFNEVLQKAMASGRLERDDMIVACRAALKGGLEKVGLSEGIQQKQILNLRKGLKRLKRSAKASEGEPDLLAGVYNQHIEEGKGNLKRLASDREVIALALELLEAWEMEPAEALPAMQVLRQGPVFIFTNGTTR